MMLFAFAIYCLTVTETFAIFGYFTTKRYVGTGVLSCNGTTADGKTEMRDLPVKIVMVEDVSSDKPITQADEIGNAMANMRGQYRIESEKYIRLISKPLIIFYHMCSGQTVCRELRVEGAEKHQRIELFEKGNIVSLTKCARNN